MSQVQEISVRRGGEDRSGAEMAQDVLQMWNVQQVVGKHQRC